MPLKISSATFLFSTLLALGALASPGAAAPQPLDVMPAPADVRLGPGRVPVASLLEATVSGPASPRVAAALARAQSRWAARLAGAVGMPVKLAIAYTEATPAVPALGLDEAYSLETGPAGVVLHARNDLGVLRGLETLLQLLRKDEKGGYLPQAAIRDRPRFAWRGLLIDVARHWEPVEVIERNLDAMAVVKLNVLHLHLTDDQGFRVESLTHPELQAQGSDGNFYTQGQIRAIIAYAAERGIRVVPEFDVPGHATSWVVSHPELASLPGPYGIERHWGVFNPVLDPTNEGTYALLADFLGEMAALFPDTFIHIGGDENNGVQWSANPAIQAFIRAHGLKDNAGLHTYFNTRIGAILAKNGKRLAGWDEILEPGLPTTSTIESWRGTEALASAAQQGYDGILANGYYIDLMYPASEHYAADPLPADSTLGGQPRTHVLGGEATMWGEWVTPETIDSRIWPRTAAIAERLWSPQAVQDVADMYRRLDTVSARLDEAGSLHARNRDRMLKYLVGENLSIPGVSSLRLFVDLIEPVKGYKRGELQIWGSQRMPLVGLADAALPESAPARRFAVSVDQALFAGPAIDRAALPALAQEVSAWASAGAEVTKTLVPDFPALREAVPGLDGLDKVCVSTLEALAALRSGKTPSKEATAAALRRLDEAAAFNGSATLLPEVGAARLLVAAAALQDQRSSLANADWRSRVTASAAPAPAN